VCFFFFFPSLRAALQTTEKRIDRACICATILFFTIVCCGFVLFVCLFCGGVCVVVVNNNNTTQNNTKQNKTITHGFELLLSKVLATCKLLSSLKTNKETCVARVCAWLPKTEKAK
jgi:hypothetical protein